MAIFEVTVALTMSFYGNGNTEEEAIKDVIENSELRYEDYDELEVKSVLCKVND